MTSKMPPPGSLREALFITVWLRRQEAAVAQTRALVIASFQKADGIQGAFQDYINSVFPFAKKQSDKVTEEMKRILEKEVSKGVIGFSVTKAENPLKDRARAMRQQDSFKADLLSRKRRRI